MIIAAVVTLIATFCFGFYSGKKFILKGLELAVFHLIDEGDSDVADVFIKLLKEKAEN